MDETKKEECENKNKECPEKKEECKKEGKGKCKELEAQIEKLKDNNSFKEIVFISAKNRCLRNFW